MENTTQYLTHDPETGETRVILKRVCEDLSIGWEDQRKKIQEHFFFGSAQGISPVQMGESGSKATTTMLAPDAYAWLCSISTRNRTEESIEKQRVALVQLREMLFEQVKRAERYTEHHAQLDSTLSEEREFDAKVKQAEEELAEKTKDLRKELGIDDLKAKRKAARAKASRIQSTIAEQQQLSLGFSESEEAEE